MTLKEKILEKLGENSAMTQKALAEAILEDKPQQAIHGALSALLSSNEIVRIKNEGPYVYSLSDQTKSEEKPQAEELEDPERYQKEITKERLIAGHKRAMENTAYGQEDERIEAVIKEYPKNNDPCIVAMKIGLIDACYSTNLARHKSKISIAALADKIVAANIDDYIKNGRPEAVTAIANPEENGINLFSFATKYCCLHNVHGYHRDDYSILDGVVKKHLPKYQAFKGKITTKDISEWQKNCNYEAYNNKITELLDDLGIENDVEHGFFRKRFLDHLIWYENRKKNTVKNLFDYATRELSQDAFLRWLFENYDCENEKVRDIVARYLKAFSKLDLEDVKTIETSAQLGKIDVIVWVTEKSGQKHIIAIEDKTGSKEHNQLEDYNNYLEKAEKWENGFTVHKVFYKTFEIGEEERKRVEDAGWKPFDLSTIAEELLTPFEKTGSEIMDGYLEFVKEGNRQMKARVLPEKDKTWCDTYAWWGFFNRVKEIYKDRYNGTVGKGIYPYSYVYFRPLGMDNGPYLEIRSRDCVIDPAEKNRYFEARLLTYGEKWENPERKKQLLGLRDRIEKLVNEGQLKRLVHYTKKNEDPKQLACCFTRKKASFVFHLTDENAFFSLLDECLADYSIIMDGFDVRN